MIAVISLLVALTLSLLIVRVATVALVATGLSRESARFQARSAFSGVGFTTSEAEAVVNHPVRRRIVMVLMLLGNLGVATIAGTAMVSVLKFDAAHGDSPWGLVIPLGLLLGGLAALWIVASSEWIEQHLNRVISLALRKYTHLNVQDYHALLHFGQGYGVGELQVEPTDWLVNRTLIQLALPQEGVLVLGVQRRDGPFIGAPRGDTLIQAYDTLLLYSRLEKIAELDNRKIGRSGDAEHAAACYVQDRIEETEDAEDRAVATV